MFKDNSETNLKSLKMFQKPIKNSAKGLQNFWKKVLLFPGFTYVIATELQLTTA